MTILCNTTKRGCGCVMARNFSYWGRICPVQTTDGVDCGLVKNISLTAIISSDTPEDVVMEILREGGIQNLEEIVPSALTQAEKVFVNGKWVGVIDCSRKFVDLLRAMRRSKGLHPEVDVVSFLALKWVKRCMCKG